MIGSRARSGGTGSAARTDDRLLAAQIVRPVSSSIAVEVELLQESSDAERNSFCNIGRYGRKSDFSARVLASADRLFSMLAGMKRDGRQAELKNTAAK